MRLALVVHLASCAQGYEADPLGYLPQGFSAAGSGQSGSPSSIPSAGSGSGGGASEAYAGEACRMGESAACTCESTGTEGSKTCRYDSRSPTMGTFSECGNCTDPNAAPDPDPGDVAGTAGSRAGSGGVSGSSGRAGSGASGSGSGGASGSGSTGGSRGGCNPACSQSCFPVGVLACCRSNGTCGCTWAPGAYCL
jgi:hypothetical protein